MALYLISYDEHDGNDYESLYKLLVGWRAQRLLESLWFAQLNGTVEDVRDHVNLSLGGDAGVLVIELSSDAPWAVADCYELGAEWLHTHIPG